MSELTGEAMVLDFDGWLGSQDEETRAGMNQHLNAVPEPARIQEKQRLANMFAVSEETGLDLGTVNERWNDIRGGYAEKQGGDWLAVKDDEAGFNGKLREVKTKQRDERQLLLGPDDMKAPDAPQKFETSLQNMVREATFNGEPYAKAVGKWQESSMGKPGYDPTRASAYIQAARETSDRMSAALAKARPVADQALEAIQKGRGVKEGEGGDIAPFELFRGMSPDEKQLAFRIISENAKSDKGVGQAFAEAMGRSFENLAIGGGAAAYRSRLLKTQFSEGQLVSESNAADEVKADFAAEMSMRSGVGMGGAGLVRAGQKTRALTAEQATEWNTQIEAAREDLDTAEQLRKFGQQVVDPTDQTGGFIFQKLVLPVADSTAIMASLSIPGAWAPALELGARSYQNDEYARLRESGMDPQQADRIALVSGTAQAALDKVQVGILAKGVPGLTRTLQQFTLRGGAASRFAVNAAGTLAVETTIELTQDHIIPALAQDNLASDPAFDVKWADVWTEAAKAAPETMLGMVLLSGLGGIAQTREQSQFVREFSSSKAAMTLRGYSEEQIAEIQNAPEEERGDLLAQYLPAKAPEGAEAKAVVERAIVYANEERAAFESKQQAEMANASEAADYAIRATRKADGWEVTQASGATVTVDSAEAARVIRDDLKQAATQQEADALVAIVDAWHAKADDKTKRETAITGETVRTTGEGVTRTRGLEVLDGKITPEALDMIRREAQMDAQANGETDIDVLVNGQNEIEFRERVADGARETVQRLELNQSESTALTAIHEQVEATWRTGIANGTITREETRGAIASIAEALNPEAARNEEEAAFRRRVQRVATGKADETELRETMSELVVAEVIGRRKDGTTMPAGSVSAAITAAIDNAVNQSEVKALGKFRALLRAVRHYFRALFGTVAALQKSKREGKGQEFDALVNKLLGLEQTQHETAVAEESAKEIEDLGMTASVTKGETFADWLANRLGSEKWVVARSSSRLLEKGYDKFLSPDAFKKLRSEFEQSVKTEKGGETFRLSSINRLELIQKRVDAALSKDPEQRRSLAKRAVDKLQTLAFNWDTERMTWSGGKILPIAERKTAAELDKEQATRQAFIAEDLMATGMEEKAARNKAREEAFEWRREQDEKQKKDWNPRSRLLRDMRTLDAILSVMPPELRAKVGGFIKLATLGSEESRAKEIVKRIDKLSTLLEKHLQKETTEAMRELLKKATPEREPGKQSRGKLGAEAHRYFDGVADVMDLTEAEVTAGLAGFDAALAAPDLTDEQALTLFEAEQILTAFGNWAKKSAADMDAALTAALEVYKTGRNQRRIIEEARLAEVADLAGQVVEALGSGAYAGTQEQKADAGKLATIAGNLSLDLKSFGEMMRALLGPDHPLARKWTRAARSGFAQRNDEIRELRKRWKAAIEKATGERGVKARRVLWDMGRNQTVTIDNAGKRKGETQSVPIDVIDKWRDGTASPDALGITQDEADALIADREAMAENDRHESLPLKRSTREGAESVKMTEAEAIFLTMLGGQEQYADALDAAGWTKAGLQKVEDQLSDAAKQLRDFMRTEYRDGYGPLANVFERMYGVALPQIRNYAPASFYHQGAERETGPEERGGAGHGMRAGFLANRKQHTAAPRLENAFATFFGHANQTAHWKGLAEFVREFSAVLGKPDVKRAIEAKHGPQMLKTLSDWTRNIEGNGLQVQSGFIDKLVSSLASAQSYVALAFKVGTLMKQSTALLGAAYRMPIGEYARGFGKLVSGQLDVAKAFNSPTIQRRLESGFAPEVRAAMNDVWNAKPTMRQAILERGMELIGLTDALFTTGSAAIAYDYHLREAKASGLSDEAAETAALREVEDIVGATAQPSDVVDRSLFEARLNSFGRLLFMFASEARQKSSLWATAWRNTLTGEGTKEDARVLVLSHLIIAPMLQAITAAWRDARSDDDDEFFDAENWAPLDFLKAIVAGPLAGLPLINEVVSGFDNAGPLGRYVSGGKSILQLFKGPDENDAEKAEWYVKRIARVMQGMDAFTGVAGSVVDQAFSVADNLLPDSESESDKKERAKARREQK
jgi:hypothetical protein